MKYVWLIFLMGVCQYNVGKSRTPNFNKLAGAKHYLVADTTYGTLALYDSVLDDLSLAADLTKKITRKNNLNFKCLKANSYYAEIGKIKGYIYVTDKQSGHLELYAKGRAWKIITGQAKVVLTYSAINDSLMYSQINVYLLTNSLGKILLSLDAFGLLKKEIDKIMRYINLVGYKIIKEKNWQKFIKKYKPKGG